MGKIMDRNKALNVEHFVGVYVGCALDKLVESPTMDVFDDYVQREVSEILNVDYGLVKKLSHPFHWELFLKDGDLAEYVQPTKDGEEVIVRLKRDYNEKDAVDLKKKVIQEYSGFLEASREEYLKNC